MNAVLSTAQKFSMLLQLASPTGVIPTRAWSPTGTHWPGTGQDVLPVKEAQIEKPAAAGLMRNGRLDRRGRRNDWCIVKVM